jgi:predicted RNA-binding protein YlxR (DUF448 family)
MVRVVRTPEGELVIDETGKQNGRGAYLCRQPACWNVALKGQQLGKSLKMEIREREKQVLREFERQLERDIARDLEPEVACDLAHDAVPESDPGS